RAAGIATAGERISDGWWNRGAEIALGSLQVATELGDHAAIATWTTALWADQRLIERRIAALEDALGTFDRRAGSDPAANLDAGRFQARAWSAMAAGHFDQARALAAQAAPRVGGSRRAQESQAALVAALAGR
ncbi:MAG: hypothetical protein O2816_19740, partial [Planctomycetota bacterium]|nr:hypothetical protein [Planctomycetota bacterium]